MFSEKDGRWSAIYEFAGVAVKITSLHTEIHRMCADYVTTKPAEVVISVTQKDLEDENISEMQDGEQTYGKDYLETLVVYRKMALALLNFDILLMHGSCVAVDGRAHLFTAISGTGKSTHVRLWRELFGDRAVMVNDDKPLIRVPSDEGPAIIFGTPWDGKHHLSNNIGVPLHTIVYLERGVENEIVEVKPTDIFHILIQQTFRTNDVDVTMKVMELLSRLAANLKFFDLHCNMEPEAAEIASARLLKT